MIRTSYFYDGDEVKQVFSTDEANDIIDGLITHLGLKNDRHLCDAIDIPPPIISKVRNGHQPLGASIVVRFMDVADLSLAELKSFIGRGAV